MNKNIDCHRNDCDLVTCPVMENENNVDVYCHTCDKDFGVFSILAAEKFIEFNKKQGNGIDTQ